MNELKVGEVCEHCGQELRKAASDRKTISEALIVRQDKLDAASAEMLAIIKRIETKLGADAETLQDIQELEQRIRERVRKQAEFEETE